MKALVIMKAGVLDGGNSGIDLQTCRASLQAMGIKYHMAVNDNMPDYPYINDHDFIVVPTMASGFNTLLDDANITIPWIGLGASAGVAGFGATPGINLGRTGLSDKFITVPWSTSNLIAAHAGYYGLSDGKALATVSANQPAATGGGAQVSAGRVAAWSSVTAGSKMYISAFKPNNHAMLPFMLQEAINDGLVNPTPQKAPLVVDLDHISGQFSNEDKSVIETIASYIPKGGIMWAGFQNSNIAYLDNMAADVAASLLVCQTCKFRYCWHDHTFSPIIGANRDAYGYSTDHTKLAQDTKYQADKIIWESKGLAFDETNFYYNSGSNSWDEASLELYSTDVSPASSPLNDTNKAGYGCVVFRSIYKPNSSRYHDTKDKLCYNTLHNKKKIRGIQIFPTVDLANGQASPNANTLDMPYNSIVDWRKNFNWLCNAISMCQTLYMHDEDFIINEQEPGVRQHGNAQIEILIDVSNYLSDVIEPFADLTKRVNRVNFV